MPISQKMRLESSAHDEKLQKILQKSFKNAFGACGFCASVTKLLLANFR